MFDGYITGIMAPTPRVRYGNQRQLRHTLSLQLSRTMYVFVGLDSIKIEDRFLCMYYSAPTHPNVTSTEEMLKPTPKHHPPLKVPNIPIFRHSLRKRPYYGTQTAPRPRQAIRNSGGSLVDVTTFLALIRCNDTLFEGMLQQTNSLHNGYGPRFRSP
jgi:hypothetical protein